jgi:hypothetical protein
MKKLAIFLLTLSVLVFYVPSVRAQAADTERWVCLEAEHCWKDPNSCSAAAKGNGHKARLSAKPGFEPLTGTPTYVVVCIGTETGQVCTTGKSDSDLKVYNNDNFSQLQSQYGFKYEGLFKGDGSTPVTNPAEWEGPYEWGDSLPEGHMHTWFALNYWDPLKTVVGEAGGQQQGSFDFATAEKDCIKIGWDPYGRIFDAGTLEPITGATVTLQVKKNDVFVNMTAADLLGGNLINPQTTKQDGNFAFVVPDGDYKLITTGALATIDTLDANYTKAYSDIYPSVTGEIIEQRGAIVHRDIPVATRNTNTAPKLMEFFYQTNANGYLVIEGRTSHPLTKLNVKTSKVTAADPNTKTPYRTVETFSADKLGKFKIEVDQNKFEKTDEYTEVFSDVELVKVDLRQPTVQGGLMHKFLSWINGLVAQVQAQGMTTSVKFEPIPQYIEGYAYDASGNVLPNATVGVYLSFSKKPYATTKTDAKGFFKLTSEYLPNFNYTLQYTTVTGAKVNTKPSVFLAQNQEYTAQNKINPFVGKDVKNNNAPTGIKASSSSSRSSLAANGFSGSGGVGRDTGEKAQNPSSPVAAQAFPILLVIVLLTVAVVVGIVVYLKKKQQVTMPPPML